MPTAPKQFRPKWIKPSGRGKREAAKEYDERRGSARARGYTRRWEKARAAHLRANPLCVDCLKEGIVTAAELVDHIEPVRSADDPLFFEPSNWQSLCGECHNRKTARDRREGKTRRVQ